MRRLFALALVAGVALFTLAACTPTPGPSPTPAPSTTSPAASQSPSPAATTPAPAPSPTSAPALHQVSDPGQLTGTLTGPCHYADGGQLPDPSCTPGAYDPNMTAAKLCAPGYSTATYRLPESQSSAFKYNVAYPAYGLADPRNGGPATELDHLVSLELGGANDASNLWPETPPTPNPKDSVENALHDWVCAATGQAAEDRLHAAQVAIATDWMTAEAVLGVATTSAWSRLDCNDTWTAQLYLDHATGWWTNNGPDGCTDQGRIHIVCGAIGQSATKVHDGGWVVTVRLKDTAWCDSNLPEVMKAAWQARTGPGGYVCTYWWYPTRRTSCRPPKHQLAA